MSYERRVEIEALPAEEGFGKWVGVVGHGTTLAERKQLAPLTIWVTSHAGPVAVEAFRYENWQFAESVSATQTKPADNRWFSYTCWHSNRDYTDYSPRASNLKSLCAETREELCEKVRALLDGQIQAQRKLLADLESARANYDPAPSLPLL